MKQATFAAGCFWGVEAVFNKIPGVLNTMVGYTGGHTENPTYKEVCGDTTGHAEAVLVEFDPSIVSYEQLLDVFWQSHTPTLVNRQGPDIGSQYRSAIFYHDDEQKTLAEQSRQKVAPIYDKPIMTEITKAMTFYKAEDYHQRYFEKHPELVCHR